ncbi:MAG: hypothetical protein LBC07_04395 [Elusimicrobiota bacterium]|nr:hypothetical protein [Elusimicrobiota bacterium]
MAVQTAVSHVKSRVGAGAKKIFAGRVAHRVSLATPMPVIAADFARFKEKKMKRVLDGRANFLDT